MTKPTPHRNAMLPRATTVCLLISLLLCCGCGHPPMLVQKYLLDYPAPAVQKAAPLDDSLKVEQFAVAQAFNTTAMVYRTSPYKTENYNYSRWRVNPGYLVADYLTRDLRDSRLFKAVLSGDSPSKARFSLEGGVQEVQELDQGEVWQASLALSITLVDTSESEITKRALFQKNHQATETMTEKTPAGLAQAISRALAQLSPQIITEAYQAARKVSK
ncbi:MAG: ABC-type transport auxiliary lipoprotein family protein [Deltaproteobacteria bacterium]|nr:ABC-type transport auxiliary lipoprotein family protein [Deltaproteobacteria bacterium]